MEKKWLTIDTHTVRRVESHSIQAVLLFLAFLAENITLPFHVVRLTLVVVSGSFSF